MTTRERANALLNENVAAFHLDTGESTQSRVERHIKAAEILAYLRGLDDAAKHLEAVAGNHSSRTVIQAYYRAAAEIRALKEHK